ncbi:MAG: hypothetical protein FWG12_07965 [Holophagaceae bacterium]|nr:hypothetical protein [Holophagaceae bacterium]
MEKLEYPSWRELSPLAKFWIICFVVGFLAQPILLRTLPPTVRERVIAVISWFLIIPLLLRAYLEIKWLLGQGSGGGWFWRVEYAVRKLIALFSSDPGSLWINWSRASEDSRMARAMIEKSAMCRNADGLYEWGCIHKGEKRGESALEAFLSAAQSGHPGAAWEVGEAARWGLYMHRDKALSRKWHEVAARNGYIPSVRILATALETGDGIDVDLEAAQRWQKRLQTVIEQLSPTEDIEQLGLYRDNADLLTQAHERGLNSSFFIAIRFVIGCANALVSRTPQEAVHAVFPLFFWGGLIVASAIFVIIQFSTFVGIVFSIAILPFILFSLWQYIHRYRPSRGLIALEKRANDGEPDAMYELGMLYRNGSVHLPQDLSRAREWLLKAAADHAEAMLEAGQLLAWGYNSGPKDPAQARRLFQRAKSLGRNEADTYLQRMADD